ncbi:Ig-like domain-containing protein, partial [Klebsiella pneumoniae]|uniref:Ig-like domain-containing protein n=1 Tax=Klebsiella pneumoniae TaxID=573 RepID=UPI003B5B1969
VVAGSNGQWSFTPAALADGTYAFRASADNGSGTVTDSPVITITIDTVAPAAPTGIQRTNDDGDPLGTGSTNVSAPTLSGSGEAGG